MPVVESYPSIVGIAQVAQAAGQGRYNQWLAEYNARSNQMKTSALMSGFQAGSNLGMSIGNMWQQQAQFAQRQGFIESQAAQQLQKDTEFTQAMIPALDPYIQQLYPHLNEEQRGAYIGSLDRRQVDAMVNNLGNASRAKAAYDQFGSPQAIRKQAKATYDKMVTGQKHHNARVQSRLEPLFQRMRDNDLGLNEGAVQREIAQILREEGEAKGGLSKQEQADLNTFEVRDDDGNLLEKVVEMQPGKYIQVKVPQPKTTGTRRTGTDGDSPDEIEKAVREEWKHQSSVWESQYGKESAQDYDFDRSLIGTLTDKDGIHYRRLTPEELTSARKHGFGKSALGSKVREHNGEFYLPTPIPPRPTMKQARRAVMSRRGIDTEPTGGPVHKLVFPHEWPAAQGDQGGTPQPGQTMPQVPRPQALPTTPAPLPPQRAESFRDPDAIQVKEEARSFAMKKIIGEGQVSKSGKAPKTTELGVATQKGLTELIGSEGRQRSPLGVEFELHVRQNKKPEEFAPRIMIREEVDSHTKTIHDFDGKLADATAYANKPGSELKGRVQEFFGGPKFEHPTQSNLLELNAIWKRDPSLASFKMKQAGFTAAEVRSFFDTQNQYNRKRNFATTVAAAAVKATPPGQRPDIANIPIMGQRQFEQLVITDAVQTGDVFLTPRDGLFIVTGNAIAAARRSYLLREHSRNQPISGFPTQTAR